MPAGVREWLAAAVEDAKRRGLTELVPMLEVLARSTTALRAAEWNDSVTERTILRDSH